MEALPQLNLTNKIEVDYSIPVGQGGIGDVFKGQLLRDHRMVAVKRPRGHLQLRAKYVKVSTLDKLFYFVVIEICYKRAIREIKIWAILDHDNVLRLVGFKLENSVLPSLVTDYMKYGTVNTFLKFQPRVHAYFIVNTSPPIDLFSGSNLCR